MIVVCLTSVFKGVFKSWPAALFYNRARVQSNDKDVVRCLRHLHQLLKVNKNTSLCLFSCLPQLNECVFEQVLPQSELHRALRSKYSHFSLNSVALTPPLTNPPF
jgi:hypothetical protein